MIDKNKFYSKKDLPSNNARINMWNIVQDYIFVNKNKVRRSTVDLRSFMYGMAFTIVIFIISLIAVKFIPNFINDFKSEDAKINSAYSKAADELERSLPGFVSTFDKSERMNQLLNVRMEELVNINEAINQYKISLNHTDITKIKQERLLELYQLKIDAINKIIQLKGDSWL